MKSSHTNSELAQLKEKLEIKEMLVSELRFLITLLKDININQEQKLRKIENKIECENILSKFNFN